MSAAAPRRHLAIVTCMDARVDPLRIFGLEVGDAHVIRNGGGRVTPDAVRSLILSVNLLGVKDIVVMHHTDCGLTNNSQDEIVAHVEEATGVDTSGIDYLAIASEPGALEVDAAAIEACAALPASLGIGTCVYDVETRKIDWSGRGRLAVLGDLVE